MARVEERLVHSQVVVGGKVAFDDLRVGHVFSPVTGRVRKVLAEPGQRVKKGTPLLTIESPDVGSAFADLAKAAADLDASGRDLARQKDLYAAQAGSARDFETAEDNFGKAKAEQQRALEKARLLRSGSVDRVTQTYTLRAPIDGLVVARNVSPGIEVQGQYSGNTAVELFTVGELDVVWVLADVTEDELPRIQPGAQVDISVIAYPSRTFAGKVDWIAGALDPATRTAKIRCAIANPDQALKPEMYATAKIRVGGWNSVAVQREALVRFGDHVVVYVRTDTRGDGRAKFERRPVVIDELETGPYVAVERGLQAGETIVMRGAAFLAGTI
jgi:cobalt-zinc-cadmium efflux system membrane fusion protein